MVSEYMGIAYDRLDFQGEPHEVNDGIVEFMRALCELEGDLFDLEMKVAEFDIGLTGWQATQALAPLESKQNEYVQEIKTAHYACVLAQLTRLECFDNEEHTRMTQDQAHDHRQSFLGVIYHLQELADRIGQRIDAKRNTANTRLILSVSAIAAGISTLSIVAQIL
jgi:hypothetical protein